jgi:hypothetical protein
MLILSVRVFSRGTIKFRSSDLYKMDDLSILGVGNIFKNYNSSIFRLSLIF